jgi:hypothetical protein
MSGAFRVEWSPSALDDWRRLPLDSARTLARAVERFPHEGLLIATGPTEYLLLVGAYAAVGSARIVESRRKAHERARS